MRRAIVFDIDGVFNTTQYLLTSRAKPFSAESLDAEKISLFNEIVAAFPYAQYFVASMWRVVYKQEDLLRVLRSRGLSDDIKKLGSTPVDPLKCRMRNDEIREWFLLHVDELDSFVVIDDSLSGEFAEQNCAIVTRVNEGLTQQHVDNAISALSVRTDKEKILQSLHCKV